MNKNIPQYDNTYTGSTGITYELRMACGMSPAVILYPVPGIILLLL